MKNEIEFFSTNQTEVFVSLANKLIHAANLQNEGKRYQLILKLEDLNGTQSKLPLFVLLRKLCHLVFSKGDPLTVKPFLERILKGAKHLGRPGGGFEHPSELYLGKGHFRWDWQAVELDEQTIKAIKIVLSSQIESVAKTQFTYKDIVVTGELYKGGVEWGNDDNGLLHNHFKIKVKSKGRKTSFDFFGSHNDYREGVTQLSPDDLAHAFHCFISDSLAAESDFEDFCSDFGYDTDSRKHYKIYKECKKSLEKVKSIISDDLWEFANEFQEAHEGVL